MYVALFRASARHNWTVAESLFASREAADEWLKRTHPTTFSMPNLTFVAYVDLP